MKINLITATIVRHDSRSQTSVVEIPGIPEHFRQCDIWGILRKKGKAYSPLVESQAQYKWVLDLYANIHTQVFAGSDDYKPSVESADGLLPLIKRGCTQETITLLSDEEWLAHVEEVCDMLGVELEVHVHSKEVSLV